MSKNLIDRLLTNARSARNALADSKVSHESPVVRALVALEGHIDDLKRLRAKIEQGA